MLETHSISKFFLTFVPLITRKCHEEEIYIRALGSCSRRTVIVIFLIIYLYWIWKKVRLIKWEQAPGDTRDWIRNHEKNINKIIKIISGIGLIFMVYCIVIPAILDIPTLVKQEYTVTEGIVESWNYSDEERLEERSISIKDDTGQEKSVIVYSTGIHQGEHLVVEYLPHSKYGIVKERIR